MLVAGKNTRSVPMRISEEPLGLLRTIKTWAGDPARFVTEALGVNNRTRKGLGLSNQQLEGFEQLRKVVLAKYRLNKTGRNTCKMLEGFEEAYAQKRGISIMSGQGTGKDAFAAWSILWFLLCFPGTRVACTAPVFATLDNVLWAEVVKWLNLRNEAGEYACLVRHLVEVQSHKIYLKTGRENESREYFAEARTVQAGSDQDQAETLAGRHAPFMMTVVDEASGVSDAVFRPIEGGMTGMVNFAILIFNPTRRGGYAYRTHFGSDAKDWIQVHWNAEDSSLVEDAHVAAMADKHGKDSNTYRIRVKGLPPTSEDDALIPAEWVYAALERDVKVPANQPITLGVDVSRQGADRSVIIARKGPQIVGIHMYAKLTTLELAGWVLEKITDYEAAACYIDATGLGWGVYDQVAQYTPRAHAVSVAESASNKTLYHRLRDELWWRVREVFEQKTLSLKMPKDTGLSKERQEALANELAEELCAVRTGATDTGKRKVESKKSMKQRGMRSPDLADALVLSYYMDEGPLYPTRVKEAAYRFNKQPKQPTVDWMGV